MLDKAAEVRVVAKAAGDAAAEGDVIIAAEDLAAEAAGAVGTNRNSSKRDSGKKGDASLLFALCSLSKGIVMLERAWLFPS